jgi:hypothetical protein
VVAQKFRRVCFNWWLVSTARIGGGFLIRFSWSHAKMEVTTPLPDEVQDSSSNGFASWLED